MMISSSSKSKKNLLGLKGSKIVLNLTEIFDLSVKPLVVLKTLKYRANFSLCSHLKQNRTTDF